MPNYNSGAKSHQLNAILCLLSVTVLQDIEQSTEIKKPDETHSIKKKYEGEIEELKTMFFAEIQVCYVCY